MKCALAVWMMLVCRVCAQQPELRWVPLREVPEMALSRVGEAALERGDWRHAVSGLLVVHTPERELAREVVQEAGFHWAKLRGRFGLDDAPVRLVVFDDAEAWWALLRRFEAMPCKAFLAEGDVFLLRGDAVERDATDLAHELTHLALARCAQGGLPLWLDEGLALHVGNQLTVAFNRYRPVKYRERNSERTVWDGRIRLFELERYPETRHELAAFHRQSKRKARRLEGRLGDGLAEFVRAVARAEGDWARCLQALGWSDEELAAFREVERDG